MKLNRIIKLDKNKPAEKMEKMSEEGITLQTVIITAVLSLAAVGTGILIYNIVADETADIDEAATQTEGLRATPQNAVVFGGGGGADNSRGESGATFEPDPDGGDSEIEPLDNLEMLVATISRTAAPRLDIPEAGFNTPDWELFDVDSRGNIYVARVGTSTSDIVIYRLSSDRQSLEVITTIEVPSSPAPGWPMVNSNEWIDSANSNALAKYGAIQALHITDSDDVCTVGMVNAEKGFFDILGGPSGTVRAAPVDGAPQRTRFMCATAKNPNDLTQGFNFIAHRIEGVNSTERVLLSSIDEPATRRCGEALANPPFVTPQRIVDGERYTRTLKNLQYDEIRGMSSDSNGNIYLSAVALESTRVRNRCASFVGPAEVNDRPPPTSRIEVWSRSNTGEFRFNKINSFANPGGDAMFFGPVAFDSQDNFYVIDGINEEFGGTRLRVYSISSFAAGSGNPVVSKIGSDFSFLGTVAGGNCLNSGNTPFSRFVGITVDSRDNVYLADAYGEDSDSCINILTFAPLVAGDPASGYRIASVLGSRPHARRSSTQPTATEDRTTLSEVHYDPELYAISGYDGQLGYLTIKADPENNVIYALNIRRAQFATRTQIITIDGFRIIDTELVQLRTGWNKIIWGGDVDPDGSGTRYGTIDTASELQSFIGSGVLAIWRQKAEVPGEDLKWEVHPQGGHDTEGENVLDGIEPGDTLYIEMSQSGRYLPYILQDIGQP